MNHTLADLHPTRLRIRLADDLAAALADDLFDAAQYWRLQTLVNGQAAASLQLSRISLATHPQAFAPLLLIEDGAALYLHSPLRGIEGFTRRSALDAALRKRAGITAGDALLEQTRLGADPFVEQAQRLVSGRVEALQAFDRHLRTLPGLPEVLLDQFRQQLGLAQAAVIDQPAQLLLQHVEGETVRRTLSLPQQLLEHYHHTALPPGQARRWLTPDGQPFATELAAGLERALVGREDDLHGTLESVLRDYWDSDGRRALLAQALADNFEQTLIRQRNDASLSQAQALWLSAALTQAASVEHLTLADGIQPELPLAAFRVLRETPEASAGYLYSAAFGFEPFADLAALTARFQALNDAAQVPAGLTADDQVSFLSMDRLQVQLSPVTGPAFSHWADALIRWQLRSAHQALPGYSAHALDIRPLVDLRLPVCAAVEPLADLAPTLAGAWLSRLQALHARQLAWQGQQPSLRDCAQALLDEHLAVMAWPCLHSANLLVRMTQPGTPQALTRPLVELLLERASGASRFRAQAWNGKLILADGQRPPGPAPQFDGPWLDLLLDQATPLLRSRYQEACSAPRPGLYEVYEQALRIEAASLRELLDATPDVVDGLDQVLDLPSARLRRPQGKRVVQVHGLALASEHGAPANLEGTFVIHAAAAAEGPVLLWSPASGLQYLPSLVALKTRLLADLFNADHRENILALVAEAQRGPLRQRLAQAAHPSVQVHTLAINGNLIQALLDSRQRWVGSAAECAWRLAQQGCFPAALFNDLLLHSQHAHPVQPDVMAMMEGLRNAELQKALPPWAKHSDPDQLQRYADLLHQCLEVQKPQNHYLNGVINLKQFALAKLRQAMQASHGEINLDLQQVRITFKTYDSLPPLPGNTPSGSPAVTHAVTMTLVSAALRQFAGQQSGVASVAMADGSTAPAWLSADYLSTLVKQLDVGQQYRAMLQQVLDPQEPRYRQRGQLFGLALCAQLRELAFRMQLQGRLSATAYDYLDAVLGMPDDIARQPVDGRDIVLRQVRLIAQPGMKPDAVTGMYLVGPRNVEQGPVLLFTPYDLEFGLKEYANREAFLANTRSSDSLAALLVWRLEELARPRYDHGGLKEPHLPWSAESDFDLPLAAPAPPLLDADVVLGNALDFLFDDNVHLLQMMAHRQTVSRAEAQWQAFITLATLGLEQGSLFLPGELAVMVNAWQSQLLLKSSAHSAVQKRWGQALAEFCAALSNLAGHRRAVAAEQPGRSTLLSPKRRPCAPHPPTPAPATVLDFAWHRQHVPAELSARLVPFEQRQVALHELLRDPLTRLYSTTGNAPFYAPIAGKVYQVGLFSGHWYIVRDEARGPRIRLNGQQDWELDLQWGLRGGGSCLGRHEPDLEELQSHIDSLFETQASGMADIHLYFSSQGQQLTAAHSQALAYVRTCLENLNATRPNQALAVQTAKILDDFFQAGPLSPATLAKLRSRGQQIFGALLEASLDPATSARLIMGRSKVPHLRLIAFTMKDDPLRRIYLTERFFNVPSWMYQYTRVANTGFEVTAHYQAGTLIHELSHQVLDTQDIAYVESSVPFLDLMRDDSAQGKRLKADTERLQQRKLSVHAPPGELFTLVDEGTLADVRGRAAKRILRITGRETLAEARDDFYADPAKRLDIMLSNADSLTLLITLLGRRRH